MIIISNKRDCCGCMACVQVCPKHCIKLIEDKEGFRYPEVDATDCIECRLCEKTCPILNQDSPNKPKLVLAGINPDENIRIESSSGGVFTMLAEKTIKRGGVVFGASFDSQWTVRHDYTDSLDGLFKFRGSKYVQSDIGENYTRVGDFLKEGREVLFTGTACQIAGLYHFLKQPYENLITVDVLCHGVPSPMIWREYLNGVCKKYQVSLSELTFISFRGKQIGWRRFGLEINAGNKQLVNEPLDQNVFLKGFLRDLYLRPSCHNCQFRKGKCHSDITIADYWGIWNHHPQMDDDLGTSLILVNSVKGEKILNQLSLKKTETSYNEALSGNSPMEHSVIETPFRQEFWERYFTEGLKVVESICKKMQPGLMCRVINKVKSIIKYKQ